MVIGSKPIFMIVNDLKPLFMEYALEKGWSVRTGWSSFTFTKMILNPDRTRYRNFRIKAIGEIEIWVNGNHLVGCDYPSIQIIFGKKWLTRVGSVDMGIAEFNRKTYDLADPDLFERLDSSINLIEEYSDELIKLAYVRFNNQFGYSNKGFKKPKKPKKNR